MSRTFRLIGSGWLFHTRSFSRSAFVLMDVTIMPIVYASLAFFLLGSRGDSGQLMAAAVGCGLMGVWTQVLFGAGSALQEQRWAGTLELLVGSPVGLGVALVGISLASATVGAYSFVATLAWGWLVYGMPLHVVSGWAFALGLVLALVSLSPLGLVFASTFVALRNANALGNSMGYPLWLLSGLLVPISLLPGWTRPLSYVLGPSWSVRALRASIEGGAVRWPLIWSLVLSAAYLVVGLLLTRRFEVLARKNAVLPLT